jgi:phenylacetate-CoA ligase
MLVIRGVNVFPSAIEEVLLRFSEISPNYRIIVERPPGGLDRITIEAEQQPDAAIADVDALTAAVTKRLADTLLISVTLAILAPGSIERIEAGKAKRVIDRRAL